jgi:L-lactate dehydrogenase complex protein LldG
VQVADELNDQQQVFLRRVSDAVRHATLPDAPRDHPPSFAAYTFDPGAPREELLDRFAREITALAGHVHRARDSAEAAAIVSDLVASYESERVLAWQPASALQRDVAAELARRGVGLVEPDLPFDAADREARLLELETIAVGLTGARAALADTGSLVLTSGRGRPRLASLLPPVHIALVRIADLYASLPAFLAANAEVLSEAANLVVVTGPSRTADIEMTLTLGVHGPRHVHAIVVTE